MASAAPENGVLSQLDLERAWRRVKWDLDNRTFVSFAFEREFVDFANYSWLEALRRELDSGTYSPQPCEICEVPKAGYLIRPGSRLDLKDHVVYTALVQEMYEAIRRHIEAQKTRKDYAYLLRTNDAIPWFQQPAFRGWNAFRKLTISRIEAGVDTVILSDISGFYENIDLARLRHILRGMDVDEGLLEPLFRCLNAWAEPRSRGIPQGVSASDLLAKAYLDGVDRRLERGGFDHIRYVDDFRVFCASRLEAKKALKALSGLLRARGLNLVTKKTELLPGLEARDRIAGQVPKIENLTAELLAAVREAGFDAAYLSTTKLPNLEEKQAAVSRQVLETAFRDHFLAHEHDDALWDESLFHYLITRLGRLDCDVAIEYCLELLGRRPEETKFVLQYLSPFVRREDVPTRVIGFAASIESIYDYQVYQVVRWLLEQEVRTEESLAFCRSIMADKRRPLWLRSHALAVVGSFGDATDLDAIEELYPSSESELERAIILCCLRRMSTVRRNSVYGRYRDGGLLNSVAVRWVRQGTTAVAS